MKTIATFSAPQKGPVPPRPAQREPLSAYARDSVEISGYALEQGAAFALAASDSVSPIPLGAAFAGIRGAYIGFREGWESGGNSSDLFPVAREMEALSGAASGFVGGCLDGVVRTALTAGVVAALGGGVVTAGLVGAAWGLTQVGLSRWANHQPPFGPGEG